MCVHFRASYALFTHFCALLGEKKDEKNEKNDQGGAKQTPDATVSTKMDVNVLNRSSGRSCKKVNRSAPSTTPSTTTHKARSSKPKPAVATEVKRKIVFDEEPEKELTTSKKKQKKPIQEEDNSEVEHLRWQLKQALLKVEEQQATIVELNRKLGVGEGKLEMFDKTLNLLHPSKH